MVLRLVFLVQEVLRAPLSEPNRSLAERIGHRTAVFDRRKAIDEGFAADEALVYSPIDLAGIEFPECVGNLAPQTNGVGARFHPCALASNQAMISSGVCG